jgi:hypothetical protein
VHTTLPELSKEGSIWLQIEAIQDTMECQLKHHMVKEVLDHWKDNNLEYATWEPSSILKHFTHLHP